MLSEMRKADHGQDIYISNKKAVNFSDQFSDNQEGNYSCSIRNIKYNIEVIIDLGNVNAYSLLYDCIKQILTPEKEKENFILYWKNFDLCTSMNQVPIKISNAVYQAVREI